MGFTLRQLAVEIGFNIRSSDLNKLDRRLNQTKGTIRSLTFLLTGFVTALTAGMGSVLSAAGEMEDAKIVLDTLSDSIEESTFLMVKLKDLTRKTPFTFRELLASALQLKSVGVETENIISDLIMIGNVAAGSPKASLKTLVDIFAQVRAGGKVFGRQMVRFRLGAIPVITELAKQLKITTTEAERMFKTQKVTFEVLRDLFKFMTGESGRFTDLMEKRAKSLRGSFSILKDIIFLLRAEIGAQGLLQDVKALQQRLTQFLETNKELIVLKLGKFFNNISKEMIVLARRIKIVVLALVRMTSLFGGLERTTKFLLNTFALLIGLQLVSFIGKLALAFTSLAVDILLARKSAALFNLLFGAGLIGLFLLLDDLRAYFEGAGSITGLIIDAFEKKFPGAFEGTQAALKALGQFFFGLWETIVGTVTGDFDKIKAGFQNLKASVKGTIIEMLGKDFISLAKTVLGVLTLNPDLIQQGLSEIGAVGTSSFKKKGLEIEKKLAAGLARFLGVEEEEVKLLQTRNFPLLQAIKSTLGIQPRRRAAFQSSLSSAFPFNPGERGRAMSPTGLIRDISIHAPATITISGVSDPRVAAIAVKEQFDNNLNEVIIQSTGAVTSGEK